MRGEKIKSVKTNSSEGLSNFEFTCILKCYKHNSKEMYKRFRLCLDDVKLSAQCGKKK